MTPPRASVLALVIGACSTSDDPGIAVAIEPAQLYAQSCARCHGVDGKGDPELRKTMPIRDFTDPTFRSRMTTDGIEAIVMSGKGSMPAFGGALSRPKMQSVAGHVKRLAAGTAGP